MTVTLWCVTTTMTTIDTAGAKALVRNGALSAGFTPTFKNVCMFKGISFEN